MIPDEEGFIVKPIVIKFLPEEQKDEKQYRVLVVTGRASLPVARSDTMSKQEAQLLLQDLEAKINTLKVRAVTVGDTLVMVEEIGRIIIEEEGEKK